MTQSPSLSSALKRAPRLIFALPLVCLLHALPVQSQSEPAWSLLCGDVQDRESCGISQELFIQRMVDGEQQTVGRVLKLTVVYLTVEEERLPFMSVQMPLGVDLRVGAVMRIDEGEERPLEFLQCTSAGCDASVRIDLALLDEMRRGNQLRVGFRPWGGEQVTAVDASLAGFSAAFQELR